MGLGAGPKKQPLRHTSMVGPQKMFAHHHHHQQHRNQCWWWLDDVRVRGRRTFWQNLDCVAYIYPAKVRYSRIRRRVRWPLRTDYDHDDHDDDDEDGETISSTKAWDWAVVSTPNNYNGLARFDIIWWNAKCEMKWNDPEQGMKRSLMGMAT